MAAANQSFYEVLGVSRNAKINDINRAYARIRSEMQREDTIPNPRLAAMAKVAYETLSDPEKRAEYDATLGILGRPKATGKKGGSRLPLVAGAVLALAVAGGAAWYFVGRSKPLEKPAEVALTPQQIVDEVAPQVGSVRAVFMSGEVRELGGAVAIAADQMVTPCHGMAAGSQLTVRIGSETFKADVMRANDALDVCTLSVKGVRAGVKFRSTLPAPKETLHAVMLGATGVQALQVNLDAPIPDPNGPAMRLKAGTALPNGTPVFDGKARLVGVVTAPHSYGEGGVAMGPARVGKGSGTTPEVPAAAAAAGAPSTPGTPATSERTAGGPTLLAEGFTTLWKEDSQLRLDDVMDNVKKGQVGVPIAYWTKWSGMRAPHVIHCLVTLDDEVVADYDQVTVDQPGPGGYLYCALTRFAVDLDTLPEGLYTFTIFVDGREVAESSARIEKKFFTRGTWAVIVLVVGMLLLAFLRRGRQQTVMSR